MIFFAMVKPPQRLSRSMRESTIRAPIRKIAVKANSMPHAFRMRGLREVKEVLSGVLELHGLAGHLLLQAGLQAVQVGGGTVALHAPAAGGEPGDDPGNAHQLEDQAGEQDLGHQQDGRDGHGPVGVVVQGGHEQAHARGGDARGSPEIML